MQEFKHHARVRDSVVVITGSSSGIGRAVAMEVARARGTVVLASRQAEELAALAEQCRRHGATALAVPTDVSQRDEVQQLCDRAVAEFGRIDCWINNAAVTVFARFELTPPQAIRQVIETNLFGVISGSRAALRQFREQGHGTLMNVSSIVGRIGSPFVSIYTTTKFAIAGLTESLRMEFMDEPNIHIVTVLPPSVDTPLFQHAANYTGRAVKPLNPVYSVKRMAKAMVHAIEHPRREVVIGLTSRQLRVFRTLAPPLAERAMANMVAKDHFRDELAESSEGNLFHADPRYNTASGGWRQPSVNRNAMIAGLFVTAGLGAFVWLASRQRPKRGRPTASVPRIQRHLPEQLAVTGT